MAKRARVEEDGADDEAPPSEPVLSLKKARRQLDALNTEWRQYTGDDSPFAKAKRIELRGEMEKLSRFISATEPRVTVQIPRSITGEPFRINDIEFHPGAHVVGESTARQLIYMIDRNRQAELDLMKQNGRQVDLGTIGERARMAAISAED